MFRKLFNTLTILLMLAGFLSVAPAGASPSAGDEPPAGSLTDTIYEPSPPPRRPKPIDQPNPIDYLRNRQRQQLLEAGQTAEANALAQTGTDRVLVLLVEFTGTDVFTWTEGVSTWDPLGIADPNEFTGTVGDCSNIITQTTVFTYTGPMHNEMPRPLSMDDSSGNSIWTEDFSPEWFQDFMFDDGVVISYTMQDGTPVFEDFTGKSVNNYYQDMSGGVYTITGDVVGWLPINHSTWYYDADQCPGSRSGASTKRGAIPGAGNSKTLVKDALDAVNAEIAAGKLPGFNWADYDQDHDGIIDRLWIVHSGYGEEDSTTLLNRTNYGEAAVWSHSSSVTPPYTVTEGVAAGPYIMMPENGGIGVFAHEYGHNLGADDLYAYGNGETSAGFWTVMADDWTGYPIGFQPPAADPWHLDNWGWLDPMVISDTNQAYEFKLGQASEFPGGEGVYRGAKIELPDGVIQLPVPVWSGDYYWWGGKLDLSNAMMTSKTAISIPSDATKAELSFDLVYDIEDEWDFLWIQASDDAGQTWTTLTNDNTQCEHDPGWIGYMYGFPEDLCAAGIGGFYGYNANWPDPEVQTFDLTQFKGQDILLRFWYMTDWGTTYSGAYVDNVAVKADGSTLFSDDAESGDANWDYDTPWQRSPGTQTYTQNFYLQWRNTNENGGYDSALGDSRWRFGPANTGMLVWYNNNFYTDNEIDSYLTDYPSIGPKARMLVVDSHPEPYRDPNSAYSFNERGNVTSRSQMRDAPFTLENTVGFTVKPPYVEEETQFAGRPAANAFHDSMGYYPGIEYTKLSATSTSNYYVTKAWDASAVVPAWKEYTVKGPADYPNGAATSRLIFRLPGGWYYLTPPGLANVGTGNPGDVNGQYGWHAKLIEEAPDHTWAKVRVWNSMKEFVNSFRALQNGDEFTVKFDVRQNIGGKTNTFLSIPIPAGFMYVPGSATGGIVPMPLPITLSTQQLAEIYAKGGMEALQALASPQAGDALATVMVWTGQVGTGQSVSGLSFKIKPDVSSANAVPVEMIASLYDEGQFFQEEQAIIMYPRAYLPWVSSK